MGYILVLVGISSILLSLVIMFQNKGQYNLRFDFGILMIFAGLWAVCVGFFFASEGNLIAIHINYIVALMMVYCLASFSIRLDGRKSNIVVFPHLIGLFISVALSIAFFYNNSFIIGSVNFNGTGSVAVQVNNPGYFMYAMAFSIAYALAVLFLLNAISRSLKTERQKYVQILISILIVGFTGLFTNLYLPSIGEYAYIWAAPGLVILVVLASSISIVRYKTFDIQFAAIRSIVYILALGVLALIYYVIVYVLSHIILQSGAYSSIDASPLNIILALLLAFIFQPIKKFFDRATNNLFYRDRYRTEEFYSNLSEVLTTSTDLVEMLQQGAREIKETLKIEQAIFIVAHGAEKYTISGSLKHQNVPARDIHELNTYIEQNGDEIILTELLDKKYNHLKRILMSHKVQLVMPLVRHGAIIGYLALGEQLSVGYSQRDLRVLNTISDELIIAIQNALSVQEVKDINASLQQRIDTATSELRRSNARLKRLDETKDEFLSMASHQLRTPLTSIKGYLSMMLEGDIGKTTPMQDKVLGEAYASSERMVHLIHDFLNVSRLQTGKFMLELEKKDIGKLVEEEVVSLRRAAKSREMKIEFTNKVGELSMVLDDNKIRQVVMNYIDNALYYSHPESTIKVELMKNADEVVLEVRDTGIGVPLNEQSHLFGKFYRATNARKQRPDGTGVGIYLAKKVIVAHGGDVLFASTPGKGSMFGFKLPLDQSELLAKKDNVNKKI